jgi:predicted DNA binding protein
MIEAEFTLGNMTAWINDIAEKYLTTIRILECIPWGNGGGQAIFEIREPQGRAPYIVKDVMDHPDVISVDINEPQGGGLRGVVGMRNCGIIRVIMSAGCFLESATAEGDGKVLFKVIVGSGGSLPELFRKLEEMGMAPELQRLFRWDERDPITKKQEEVLHLALEKGYFDYPKRINAADLAKLCGVSRVTLNEILSRGQRNILRDYFEGD